MTRHPLYPKPVEKSKPCFCFFGLSVLSFLFSFSYKNSACDNLPAPLTNPSATSQPTQISHSSTHQDLQMERNQLIYFCFCVGKFRVTNLLMLLYRQSTRQQQAKKLSFSLGDKFNVKSIQKLNWIYKQHYTWQKDWVSL